ncbi:protein FAM151B isoform X2 [Solenopsis invicta]|nr:protein FAM151B isoform X2 [Solenopsis invicta]
MSTNNCSNPCYPNQFFQNIEGNLTKIVWAHAVNSRAKLEEALLSKDVMMLEADVVLGNLNNNTEMIPIMAHPPNTTSDLSLEDFLNITSNSRMGIKLDFKTDEAFENSKSILKNWRSILVKRPVFLNADILAGPVNATTIPLNATAFLKGANETMPESILSIGWTTRYGKEFNVTEGQYTVEQLKNMTDILKENSVTQSVTYPVRACFAAGNIDGIKDLLKNTTSYNSTLTIWSSKNDSVDATKLSELIREVGVKKVYVDVSKDLKDKLNFSGASAMTSTMVMNLGASLVLLALSRML